MNLLHVRVDDPLYQKESLLEVQMQVGRLMFELMSKVEKKEEEEKALNAEADYASDETKEEMKNNTVEFVGTKRRIPSVSECSESTTVAKVVTASAQVAAAEAEPQAEEASRGAIDKPYIDISSTQPAATKCKRTVKEDAMLLLQAVRAEHCRSCGLHAKLLESL